MIFFTQENITSQNQRTFFPFGTSRKASQKGITYPGSIHYFIHKLLRLKSFEFLIDSTLPLINLSGKEDTPHLLLEIEGTKKTLDEQYEPLSIKVFSNFDNFPTQNSIAFKIKSEISKNISSSTYAQLLSDERVSLHSLSLNLTAFRGAASGFFGANPDSCATLELHITKTHYELHTYSFFKNYKEFQISMFNDVRELLENEAG